MKIYLVRHGQTGGNIAHRHQAEDTPLTAHGKTQAREVAEIIRLYKPTHLITSTHVRAVETASIIGEVCDIVPETKATFIELGRPTYMYGHYHRSIRSLWFYVWWYLGFVGGTGEREGESYSRLRQRFVAAKAELALYPRDSRIVIVSHAAFIGLFIAHLCRKRALNPFRAAVTFYRILTMPNTFITPVYFDFHTSEDDCPWIVGKQLESS